MRPGLSGGLRASALAAAVLAAAACGGDSATEPSLNPARLVLDEEAPDTVAVGRTMDPPLSIRVENPGGEPVEGVPVRFLLVSGPGEVMPNLAVTNSQGIAETDFRAGSEFGTSVVRADIPSASAVESRRMRVVTVAAGEVSLSPDGGAGQRAETGSQLPLPFEARVTTPEGTPAAGVRVAWVLEAGTSGAHLGSDTTFTDGQGRTRTLLTLGSEPGEHRVRAHAVGGVVTDTVRFAAEAVASLSSSVAVDSVAPLPLRAGGEAVLFGSGLGTRPADVEVRVEGVAGDVVAARPDRVRFRVPSFADRCRPEREVGVRALVSGEVGNGRMVTLVPATSPTDLAVGESRTVQGPDAVDCLQLAGSSGGREYLVAAGTASRTAGQTHPLRLFLSVGGAGDGTSGAATVAAARRSLGSASDLPDGARTRELQLREQARREMARQGFRGRLRPSAPPRATGAAPEPPSVGEVLSYNFAVGGDLSVACDATSRVVGARVRAVGPRVVLAEDTLSPAETFSPQGWRELRDTFEEVVFPTDSAFFGAPADIDGNGRIVVLFTPEVNRLTPRSAAGRIGGFFLPLDLTDSGDPAGGGLQGPGGSVCPASNEAELLYLAVADPQGRFSSPVRGDQARRSARSIIAHELQHLLSAEQRLVLGSGDFDDLGTVWLQEGLAHLAQEVVGLRRMGRDAGANLGWDQVAGDRRQLDLFNTYHLDNFASLDLFMRQPSGAPVLAPTDPGGVRSFQMRGFAWSFLRWLGDRGPAGAQADLFRRLSRGGPSHLSGIANLEASTGEGWEELVADYRMALPLDDAGVEGAGGRGIATWNLRSVFAGLNENPSSGASFPFPFPLAVADLPLETTAVDFDVRASTAAYFRISALREARPTALRLTGQGGGPLGSGSAPQLTVTRTR